MDFIKNVKNQQDSSMVKPLTAKPDDRNFNPNTHKVGRESRLPQLSSDLHM